MLVKLIHAMIVCTLAMTRGGRDKKTCWQCKGSGMIRRWYKDGQGKNQYEDVICNICHGSGTLEG